MMHSINRNLQIVSVSDFWLEKMGYERNEVIGKSPAEFLTEESKKLIQKNLTTLFETGEVGDDIYGDIFQSKNMFDSIKQPIEEPKKTTFVNPHKQMLAYQFNMANFRRETDSVHDNK